MNAEQLHRIFRGLSIPYRDSPRAINVCCPSCRGATSGKSDIKFRCGVFLGSRRYHCFRCHQKGDLLDLLKAFGVERDDALRLLGEDRPEDGQDIASAVRARLHPAKTAAIKSKVKLPPNAFPICGNTIIKGSVVDRFLAGRNIDLTTAEDYGARYTPSVGSMANRMILPIQDDDGRLVAWQARDMTGMAKAKYLSEGPMADCLYWSAETRPPWRIYLVEGVLDCWRMQYNAVASFTCALTRPQRVGLLSSDWIEELVVAWDADAFLKARVVARDLAPIIRRVGVVRLPDGQDPDGFGEQAVRELPIDWV